VDRARVATTSNSDLPAPTSRMRTHTRAVWCLVAAALLWSLGGLLIKWIDWHPLAIAGARSAIAAVTLLVLLPRPRFTFSAVQCAAAGCYVGTVALFVSATKLTTAANAIFLQYTAPIYIALFGAWLLHEKPSRLDWLLLLLTLGGIGLFFIDQITLSGWWGNVAALASGLSFAGLALLLRKQKDAAPADSVLLGNLLTALLFLPFMLRSAPGRGSWLALGLLGVFQLGVSYALFTQGIRHVRALEASLLSTIEPVLNPIWVALALGERPQFWAIVGGLLVLTSATIRGVLTAQRLAEPPGRT
jgi:drug/metabolite transporter (DMT)-like permease